MFLKNYFGCLPLRTKALPSCAWIGNPERATQSLFITPLRLCIQKKFLETFYSTRCEPRLILATRLGSKLHLFTVHAPLPCTDPAQKSREPVILTFQLKKFSFVYSFLFLPTFHFTFSYSADSRRPLIEIKIFIRACVLFL